LSNDNENEDESSSQSPDAHKGIRVFVYGTLKEGHGNHGAYLEGNSGATKLGRCFISGAIGIADLGFFPCVVKTTDGVDRKVCGEVYVVDSNTFDALDMLEGHPDWYKREQVETPWKKAWCYFMPEREGTRDLLESGIWDATKEEIAFMAEAG
jgi:gamma-glutamylcyclotransferase (GGCT)/AIG2-like uncharacterized protein YtfP